MCQAASPRWSEGAFLTEATSGDYNDLLSTVI
jgi:hypothetical protein